MYIGSLRGHKGSVLALAVKDDMLYSGSKDHTIKVSTLYSFLSSRKAWDLERLHCVRTLTGHDDAVIALSTSDAYLYSADPATVKVKEFTLKFSHVIRYGIEREWYAIKQSVKKVVRGSRHSSNLCRDNPHLDSNFQRYCYCN